MPETITINPGAMDQVLEGGGMKTPWTSAEKPGTTDTLEANYCGQNYPDSRMVPSPSLQYDQMSGKRYSNDTSAESSTVVLKTPQDNPAYQPPEQARTSKNSSN